MSEAKNRHGLSRRHWDSFNEEQRQYINHLLDVWLDAQRGAFGIPGAHSMDGESWRFTLRRLAILATQALGDLRGNHIGLGANQMTTGQVTDNDMRQALSSQRAKDGKL